MLKTDFFSPNCEDEALTRVDAIMAHGKARLMMAVCYVTAYGVTELLDRHSDLLMKEGSFIVVGDSPPTDARALNILAEKSPDGFAHVRYYKAKATGYDCDSPRMTGLMHDKLIYADDGITAKVWNGSHNFTKAALNAINIEAATITEGPIDEPFFQDVRKHLMTIKNLSMEGPIPEPDLEEGTPLIYLEASATDNVLEQLRLGKINVAAHFLHENYDELCTPPKIVDPQVRLLIYRSSKLTNKGPVARPIAAFKCSIFQQGYTKNHEYHNGDNIDVPDVKFDIEETDGPMSPLKLVKPRRRRSSWTVCGFTILSETSIDEEVHLPRAVKPPPRITVNTIIRRIRRLAESPEPEEIAKIKIQKEPTNDLNVQAYPATHGALKPALEEIFPKSRYRIRFRNIGGQYPFMHAGQFYKRRPKHRPPITDSDTEVLP
jgi:hypothetical protein